MTKPATTQSIHEKAKRMYLRESNNFYNQPWYAKKPRVKWQNFEHIGTREQEYWYARVQAFQQQFPKIRV